MIKTFVIIFCLLVIVRLIAFFAGSETAFLSINKIKVRQLVQEKRKNARTVKKLRENVDELLTIILIGINFLNTLGSALATALAIELIGSRGVGIATIGFTFLSVIFGEIVPKTVAGWYSDQTVLRNAVPLLILEKAFYPLVWLFSAISKGTAHLAKNFLKDDSALVTEEELKTLINIGESEGTIEHNESAMLNKIFKFNDLNVHGIMKHRSMVRSVPVEADRSTVVEEFVESGLSMIPVYEDNIESIVGVIHYKSVLLTEKSIPAGTGYARAVMKNVLFVPETFTALELLSKFKKERTDFAVALNEQGQMAGVVTVDDILRVVFGRMTDEDKSLVKPEERIKLVGLNEFIVPGDMKLEDVNSVLKINLESEEYSTLGGWLLEHFDELPSTGEIFRWNGILFYIEDQAQRKIRQVRVSFGQKGR